MRESEWELSSLILLLLLIAALFGIVVSLYEHHNAQERAQVEHGPRSYEVHCEGPNGWEGFTVDFNAYGEPRSFRQGAMLFETTQGVKVHGSNCIAKHPAEWRR